MCKYLYFAIVLSHVLSYGFFSVLKNKVQQNKRTDASFHNHRNDWYIYLFFL